MLSVVFPRVRAATSRPLVVMVGLTVAIGACSPAKGIEDTIADEIKDRLDVSADITCPKDAQAEKGASFDCTATVGEKSISLHVTYDDDEHSTVTPVGLLAKAADVEEFVSGEAAPLLGATPDSIDCGDQVVVANPGEPFDCEVVVDGVAGTVGVTVDEDGNVTELIPK